MEFGVTLHPRPQCENRNLPSRVAPPYSLLIYPLPFSRSPFAPQKQLQPATLDRVAEGARLEIVYALIPPLPSSQELAGSGSTVRHWENLAV